jgi:hypothetical protein
MIDHRFSRRKIMVYHQLVQDLDAHETRQGKRRELLDKMEHDAAQDTKAALSNLS